jgi:hypothetical protein
MTRSVVERQVADRREQTDCRQQHRTNTWHDETQDEKRGHHHYPRGNLHDFDNHALSEIDDQARGDSTFGQCALETFDGGAQRVVEGSGDHAAGQHDHQPPNGDRRQSKQPVE